MNESNFSKPSNFDLKSPNPLVTKSESKKTSKEESSESTLPFGKWNHEIGENSSSTQYSENSLLRDSFSETNYAFPTNIPSVITKQVTVSSIDNLQLSLFAPTTCCCSYCLKMGDNLYSLQFTELPILEIEEEVTSESDYTKSYLRSKVFCSSCLDFFNTRFGEKKFFFNPSFNSSFYFRKDFSILNIQVPHPLKRGFKMPLRYIPVSELRTLNQISGGLMFWDTLPQSPILKRVISDMKEKFDHWKHEWTIHLAKTGTKVWSETIFSQFIDEEESL